MRVDNWFLLSYAVRSSIFWVCKANDALRCISSGFANGSRYAGVCTLRSCSKTRPSRPATTQNAPFTHGICSGNGVAGVVHAPLVPRALRPSFHVDSDLDKTVHYTMPAADCFYLNRPTSDVFLPPHLHDADQSKLPLLNFSNFSLSQIFHSTLLRTHNFKHNHGETPPLKQVYPYRLQSRC